MIEREKRLSIFVLLGLAAASLWAVIRSGINLHPAALDMVEVAESWPERPTSWMLAHYADTPLNLLAFQVLGLDTGIELQRLGLLTSLLALAALVVWTWRVVGNSQASRGARLVVLSPVVAVLLTTIGSYDSFTVLAWAIAVWSWQADAQRGMWAAGVLLGFQHFEHALLGSIALVLTWHAVRDSLDSPLKQRNPLNFIPGIVVGKVALILTFLANGQSPLGRTGWIERYFGDWSRNLIATFPSLLWALFAGLWLLVILVFLRLPNRRHAILFVAGIAVGLLGTALSADRPRVFVVVMLPSLLIMIVAYLRSTETSKLELRAVEALAWLGPPIVLAGRESVNTDVVQYWFTALWMLGLGGPG